MLHPYNCHHFFQVRWCHPYNCHHFLMVLPPKSSSGAPWGARGCRGGPRERSRAPKERQKSAQGSPGERPGAPRELPRAPKGGQKGPRERQNGSRSRQKPPQINPRSEKVDFGGMCVSIGRHEGFFTFPGQGEGLGFSLSGEPLALYRGRVEKARQI